MRFPSTKAGSERMPGKRKRTAALLVAGAALLTGVGVASPAQAAQSAPTTVASAAGPASGYIYKVYETALQCDSWGRYFVGIEHAKSYSCKWDSPGYALWLYS